MQMSLCSSIVIRVRDPDHGQLGGVCGGALVHEPWNIHVYQHLAKAAEGGANHLPPNASVGRVLVEMYMDISSAFSNTSPLELKYCSL
jgi:hypothetical protein